MNWRSTCRFPITKVGEWQVSKTGAAQPSALGLAAVQEAIAKWHPLSSVLISSPHSTQLLPPLCVEEISAQAHTKFLFRSRLSIQFLLLCASICALAGQANDASDGWQFAALLIGLSAFLMSDYATVLRKIDATKERALFANWVRTTSRPDLIFWGCTMLGAGATQFGCESWLGGAAPYLHQFGTTFRGLEQGEYWRLLTGPFIHHDLVHWASNSCLTVLVGIISAKISRPVSALTFLTGSAAGAITTWLVGDPLFTSYVGVSAGTLAMLGFCAGTAWRHPELFPKSFAFTLVSFGVMNVFVSWIYSQDAANEAHVIGIVIGLLAGYLTRPNRKFSIEQQ
ncbi:rhomboid family intramembrane serine protease [Massilia sp. CF038]|uniref:rhomboid family intramembrane serine protease n=1 Tax=Massilia sp. CF038 TaxID=1881045 RepID=UPI0009119992|nr:rhomboid family intramembrane serine protease [Massilia sp. CF038]SHH02896.1 Rhomboid family protein [Massilia sp. CF038]